MSLVCGDFWKQEIVEFETITISNKFNDIDHAKRNNLKPLLIKFTKVDLEGQLNIETLVECSAGDQVYNVELKLTNSKSNLFKSFMIGGQLTLNEVKLELNQANVDYEIDHYDFIHVGNNFKMVKTKGNRDIHLKGLLTLFLPRKILMKYLLNSEIDSCLSLMLFNKNFDDLGDFDFTFIVKGEESSVEFKTHKKIMKNTSEVMKTMFLDRWNDQSVKKSSEITDIEPDIFQILVYFIYGDVEEFKETFKVEFAFEVFYAAQKYQIENLQKYCVAKIYLELTGIENIVETYTFSDFHDIKDLKLYCWDIIQFDLIKFFVPMNPLPAIKLKEYLECTENYFKIKRENEKRIHQTNLSIFLPHLDEDKRMSELTIQNFTENTMKSTSCYENDQQTYGK